MILAYGLVPVIKELYITIKILTKFKNYTRNHDGLPITWVRDIKLDDKEIWYATDVGILREIISTGQRYPYYRIIQSLTIFILLHLPQNRYGLEQLETILPSLIVKLIFGNLRVFLTFHKISNIVGFYVVGDKMVLSMYNIEDNFNGFFHANWDGTEGKSTAINEGTEKKNRLENIFVTGVVDNGTSPFGKW